MEKLEQEIFDQEISCEGVRRHSPTVPFPVRPALPPPRSPAPATQSCTDGRCLDGRRRCLSRAQKCMWKMGCRSRVRAARARRKGAGLMSNSCRRWMQKYAQCLARKVQCEHEVAMKENAARGKTLTTVKKFFAKRGKQVARADFFYRHQHQPQRVHSKAKCDMMSMNCDEGGYCCTWQQPGDTCNSDDIKYCCLCKAPHVAHRHTPLTFWERYRLQWKDRDKYLCNMHSTWPYDVVAYPPKQNVQAGEERSFQNWDWKRACDAIRGLSNSETSDNARVIERMGTGGGSSFGAFDARSVDYVCNLQPDMVHTHYMGKLVRTGDDELVPCKQRCDEDPYCRGFTTMKTDADVRAYNHPAMRARMRYVPPASSSLPPPPAMDHHAPRLTRGGMRASAGACQHWHVGRRPMPLRVDSQPAA